MGEAEAGLAVIPGIRLTDRIGIGVLTRLIDRDLVDDVLAGTGRAGTAVPAAACAGGGLLRARPVLVLR